MSTDADRFWCERMAVRYLDALDAGDLDLIVAIWEEAEKDPKLLALLYELNEGLDAEEGLGADFESDASRVIELARRHMPGAFPVEEPAGPLTAADVARRLEAEPEFRRIDSADRADHARLLSDVTPIPEDLGQLSLDRWIRGLGVSPGPTYRRAFRKVAVLLSMNRGQQEGRLAAARKANPPDDPKRGPS